MAELSQPGESTASSIVEQPLKQDNGQVKPLQRKGENLRDSPQQLFTVNQETGEVSIVGKDEQGKPKLHDPVKSKNLDLPVFEIIPHKGFLGNFIINFRNNYKASDNLEILAVPIAKSPETAAQEIKAGLPGLKDNLIKGLETLKEKTGISGITDKTERAFINLPDELQQKLLEKLALTTEGNNAYTFKANAQRWQLPNEETGKLTFRQELANLFLLAPGEDLPKTSFKDDLRNFVHFLKGEEFEFKDLNRTTDNQTIRQKNNYTDMQATKFNPDNINWKDAERLGLTRDLLEKTDNMQKLLNGEKTSLFQGLKGDLGGVKVSIDGKFRLLEDPTTGKPTFVFHGVRANLDIPKNFLGYEFSNEDKENLKGAGNLNKQVTLTDKSTNTEFKAYIGVDKETKELVAIRADRIKIPNVLKGVTLTNEQKNLLEQGKPAVIAGMKDDKNLEFSATVQIDPAKKGFSFRALPETAIKETVKPENKIQVAANNSGSKAETVKPIDKVPSQQHKESEIMKLKPGRKRSGPKL